MGYNRHQYAFTLSTGRRVYWNRITGPAVEHDYWYLAQPSYDELCEIEQYIADNDEWAAEDAAREKYGMAQNELAEMRASVYRLKEALGC